MKIQKLFIDGFGIFHNQEIGDFSPFLTIILGNNESGKSTCLAFIRTILFGFPDGRSGENNYPPRAGGQHGGRIVLLSSDGLPYIVERRPGAYGGKVTVIFPDQTKTGKEVLQKLFGTTSRELFRNIFAFSLTELQNFETLNTEAVKEAIYSAGAGINQSSLVKLKSRLDRREEDLFKPGGSNPKINRLLSQLENIRKEIRSLSGNIERYDNIQRQIEQFSQQVQSSQNEKIQLIGELDLVKRLLQVWPDWISLCDAKEKLAKLETIDNFPTDGISRLDALLSRLWDFQQELDKVSAELERKKADLSTILINESLLAQKEHLVEIQKNRGHYDAIFRELSELKPEMDSVKQSLHKDILRLGSDWTEDRILKFDQSIATQEDVRRYRELLQKNRSTHERAQQSWEEQKGFFSRTLNTEEETSRLLKSLPKPPEPLNPDMLRQLQIGFNQYISIRHDLPLRREELKKAKEDLSKTIQELDPAWDIKQILEFDSSIQVREEVRRHRLLLSDAEGRLQHQKERIETARRNYELAGSAKREAEQSFQYLPEPLEKNREVLEDKKRLCRTFRGDLSQRDRFQAVLKTMDDRVHDLREEQNILEGQRRQTYVNLPSWLGPLFLGMGIIFAIFFALMAQWMVAGLGGILLVSLGLFIWLLKKHQQSEQQRLQDRLGKITIKIKELEQEKSHLAQKIHEVEERMAPSFSPLRISEVPTMETLEMLEGDIEKEIYTLGKWLSAQEHLNQAIKTQEMAKQEWQQEKESFSKLERQLLETQSEWNSLLEKMGFSVFLSPDSVLEVFGKIDSSKEKWKAIQILEERIQQMLEVEAEYLKIAGTLFSVRGRSLSGKEDFSQEIDRFLSDCEREDKERQQWEIAEQRYKNALSERERAERVLKDAEEGFKQATKQEKELKAQWEAWLVGRGLHLSLSPDGALETLALIDSCLQEISRLDGMRRRIQSLETEKVRYEDLINQIRKNCSLDEVDPEDIPGAADDLIKDIKHAEEQAQRKSSLQKELQINQDSANRYQMQIERLQKEVNELLISGGAKDEDEFRRRAEIFGQRKSLKEEISQLESNIKRLLGRAEEIDYLTEELALKNLEDLEQQKVKLEQALADLEESLEKWKKEQNNMEVEARQLASSQRVSELRVTEEALLEELNLVAREWATMVLARKLIKHARERYEKERQPEVIREASHFFSTMNRGRYPAIVSPLGEGRIEIVGKDSSRKNIDQLSRGTAEQLYLSLRLGFIKEFTRRSQALPVIMDEIIVNFDPHRAKAAAQAIVELAQEYQILYFTCHPETVEVFQGVDAGIKIVRLMEGQVVN